MHWRPILIAAGLLLIGCSTHPWYRPPTQTPSMGEAELGTLGHFVYMSQAEADAYVVSGMREKSEGVWRWAHERAVLKFYLPEVGRLRFRMDFTLPDNTFQETGPVMLTLALNGEVFDRMRCDKPGQHRYEHSVPVDLVRTNAVNQIAITPDKTAGRAAGERLGFVLTSAGFAE